MESIDKLREFVKHADGWGMMHSHVQTINEIADAIEDEAKRAWQDGFDTGFTSADKLAADREEDMAEHGWVKLPVDADGVPIHIGDVLDPPADCDDYMPLQVVRLTYDGYEKEWFFDGAAGGFTGMVGKCMDVAGWTHHHAPTVEDVLRGVVTLCYNTWKKESAFHFCDVEDMMDSGNIAEYAAKLRLAGDGE